MSVQFRVEVELYNKKGEMETKYLGTFHIDKLDIIVSHAGIDIQHSKPYQLKRRTGFRLGKSQVAEMQEYGRILLLGLTNLNGFILNPMLFIERLPRPNKVTNKHFA
jgi:hypothetical protein